MTIPPFQSFGENVISLLRRPTRQGEKQTRGDQAKDMESQFRSRGVRDPSAGQFLIIHKAINREIKFYFLSGMCLGAYTQAWVCRAACYPGNPCQTSNDPVARRHGFRLSVSPSSRSKPLPSPRQLLPGARWEQLKEQTGALSTEQPLQHSLEQK